MEDSELKKSQVIDWKVTERRLKLVFWPIFVVAECLFIAVQIIYVATRGISVLRSVLNMILFNVVLVTLLLLCYVLIRRILLRVYYYESRILTIEDISTDAVFTQDRELRITSWSKGAERIFGYSEEEAVGRSVAILIPDPIPERDIEITETLLREGLVMQRRTVRRRKDGTLFPAETSISLLIDPEGEPEGGLTVLRDITGQVEMEEELIRKNAELEGYAHVVSHDLKAPLAGIKLAVEAIPILLKAPASEETAEQLEQMKSTINLYVQRSSSLIEDLLTLAQAGQRPDEVSDVDIGGLLRDILEELTSEIDGRGVSVSVDDDLGAVRANPTHMYQLFANLVRNAVRHNDSPEPEIQVVNLGPEGNAHRYLVRDNGSGIPEDVREKIFEPFFKGSEGDTGIGLSTVAKIVSVYDGEIRVYNDGGACFEFTINDF